jgi:TRAP-type mannitol/chloroaromatic compound transport system permease small subunit
MTVRLIRISDRISVAVGHVCSWLTGLLMVLVCVEVIKRYLLNAPSDWALDLSTMLYGACFMLCGSYALSQDAHVRGDFLYGRMKPRTQAGLDLALYIVFFITGVLALCIAGWEFARDSWMIGERSSIAANGPVVYPLKALIPIAGALVLLQGVAEMARCVVCIREGDWPPRIPDAMEEDVVEEQLASSNVDPEALQRAREALLGAEKRGGRDLL